MKMWKMDFFLIIILHSDHVIRGYFSSSILQWKSSSMLTRFIAVIWKTNDQEGRVMYRGHLLGQVQTLADVPNHIVEIIVVQFVLYMTYNKD